jgi:hypothetical protein
MSSMERRKTMRRNLLIALLLMLPTLPALADQADSAIFSQARSVFKVVQLSAEERRDLRERWEEASPEERVRMRQFFQDRLRQLPTPAQEAVRIPFPDTGKRDAERDNRRGRDANRKSERYVEPDRRFGFGYEKRQHEEDRPEYPAWPGNRRQRDD